MKLLTTLLLFTTLLYADPKLAQNDLITWAAKIEKLHPITDAQGHGSDIGSEEWLAALDKELGITDKAGHGPELGSEEWRTAVEHKLAPEKRELLSSHSTTAKFTGIKEHKCMGLTSLCPDRCGESGDLASFEIVKYLAYEKPGKYGDPKQEVFQILIQDNMGHAKVHADILAKIRALKPGEEIKLEWNHNYVSKAGSKFPERIITKIEKTE